MDLDADERVSVVVKIVCTLTEPGAEPEAEPPHMLSAYRKVRRASGARMKTRASVTSANELFNTVVDRAASDIDMLLTDTRWGLYPYAGIPWYSARSSAATASSPRWSCCGRRRRSPRAC